MTPDLTPHQIDDIIFRLDKERSNPNRLFSQRQTLGAAINAIRQLKRIVEAHHDIAIHKICGRVAQLKNWGADCAICSNS